MQLRRYPEPEAAGVAAAACVGRVLRTATTARGRCSLALSGGRTASFLLDELARQPLPWHALTVFQVDERVAPRGESSRNLTELWTRLLACSPPDWAGLRAMPVELSLPRAAAVYAEQLERAAGRPPVLDVVHLGLGVDGHTASLVPGDPVLAAVNDVAVTGLYRGHPRVTLTYPCLARARHRVWLVTGAEKAAVLAALVRGDLRLPASRLAGLEDICYLDEAAAAALTNDDLDDP